MAWSWWWRQLPWKIGGQAFARIRRTEEIDVLITDAGIPDDAVRKFEEAGVKVMIV